MQRTFGPIVGLDPVVPVGPHPEDDTICSDGTSCKRRHAFIDCKGDPHSSDGDRVEANNAIVADILDERAAWASEYCTENEDFATGYDCIINEGHHDWDSGIEDWIESNYEDFDVRKILTDNMEDFNFEASPETEEETAYTFDDCIDDNICAISNDKLVSAIKEDINDCMSCDVVYSHNEYARHSGHGCCLGGIEIGDQEEQIGIDDCDELKALHDSGELNDCLDHYNGDAYINRSCRREKNKETGYYENVGRETYDAYGSDHPDILFYHYPDGRWDWVICQDHMEDYFKDALCRLFHEAIE